jgi:hypothetical protein
MAIVEDDFEPDFSDAVDVFPDAPSSDEDNGVDLYYTDDAGNVVRRSLPEPEEKGPKPYKLKNTRKRILIGDTETDPFADGRVPKAFTAGLYDTETGDYEDFWGADCVDQFVAHIRKTYTDNGIQVIVYFHNLGGYDIHMGLLDYLEPGSSPSIIGSRIAACYIDGQEYRDSYRIIPVPLKDYNKDDIDYDKLEPHVRDSNRPEILAYQRSDCVYLGELVTGFHSMFGDRPTIGNTAINYLQSFHSFERMRDGADARIRPFFFGGRNQCFEAGVLRAKTVWKIYDRNSMYPAEMANNKHPVSAMFRIGRYINDNTAFVEWEGRNFGAVPVRGDLGQLDFTIRQGRFKTTIHEWKAGLETGSINPRRIIQTINFDKWTDFSEFVLFCYEQRQKAKDNGDKQGDLFWKLVMNAAYGKFAQDPRKYWNFVLSVAERGIPEGLKSVEFPDGFRPSFTFGDNIIWAKPSKSRSTGFYNVATGASITGAARANLLRAIKGSTRPIYCDTDSILCEAIGGVEIHPSKLGAWDFEAEGDLFACAGKKMYALLSSKPEDATDKRGKPREKVMYQGQLFYCVKKASKGAVLTANEIMRVAQGEVVRYISDRPNFNLDGSVEFISRDIRRTG